MAFLFCEGFETINSSTYVGRWDSGGGNVTRSTGRFAQYSGLLQSGGALTKTLATNYTTLIVGFAFKQDSYWTSNPLLTLYDGTTAHVYLYTDASGHLVVKRGDGTTLDTSVLALPVNAWRYIELKVTINNSSGVAVLQVDNTNWLNLTSQDTQNGGSAQINKIRIMATGFNQCYFDDLYIYDTSGSVNNDFAGDSRIETVWPSGAGDTTQMSASTGSNYACVDEDLHDSDSTYVYEPTAGDLDLYHFTNFATTGTIRGVQVTAVMRKDDAGTVEACIVNKVSSTVRDESDGMATMPLNSDYTFHPQVIENDPDTSAAWTFSALNGAQFGVKRVT